MNTKTLHTTIAVVVGVAVFSLLFGQVFFPYMRIPVFDIFGRSIADTQREIATADIRYEPSDGYGTAAVITGESPARELLGGLVTVTDLNEGNGLEAKNGNTVSVGYIGTYTDAATGEDVEFDRNTERGTPFTFILGGGQVIPGFDAGVAGMRENGKRIIFIQPEAGYGDRTAGSIPPNTALRFVVELYEVQQ